MKRIIPLLLAAAMTVCLFSAPSSAAPQWLGDANGDGVINARDVVLIVRYLAGWDVTPGSLADFNSDGKVNLRDTALIIRYLAGYNVSPDPLLEAQYGVCAVDFEIPEPEPTGTVGSAQFGFDTKADDNSTAFAAAVTYLRQNPGTTLLIEKGVYRMKAGVSFTGLENCVIDGGGSTFLFSASDYFDVAGGSNLVMFRNMTVDWDWENSYKLTSTVRVKDVRPSGSEDTVLIDYEFFTVDDASYAVSQTWDSMIPLDPESLTVGVYGVSDRFFAAEWNTDLTLTGRNTVTATVPKSRALSIGSVWLIRHANYGDSVFTVAGASNITCEDITIYSIHGQGVLVRGSNTHHIKLSGVTIGLNPETADKYRMSTTADAINIADSGGYFIIENCDVGYQGDDGLNIHDNVGIVEDVGDDFIVITVMNSSAFSSGTQVRFKNGTDFTDIDFTANVTRKKSMGNSRYTLTLDAEVPLEVDSGTVVADCSVDSSHYIIRNNYFHENRARGILLNSSDGLVENNRFYKTQFSAINVSVDYGTQWLEGTGIDNLIIRNNRFESCNVAGNGAAITFYATNTRAPGSTINGTCFRNLLISGNTFINTNKQAISARSASALAIVGNRILNPDGITSPYEDIVLPDRGRIELKGRSLAGITVAHNEWESSPYIPEDVNKTVADSKIKEKELTEYGNVITESTLQS